MARYLKVMELSELQLSSVVGGRHYSPSGGGGGSSGLTLPSINVNAPVYLNVNVSIISIVNSKIYGDLNIYSSQTNVMGV